MPMELEIILLIFVTAILQTLEASSYSCPISRATVQVVDDCPDTEDKWKEAAARKNCEAYASQCDEPDRLLYHCVINTDISQTLEVCAYAQNIVLGHCTEYSSIGNLIQPHLDTNCLLFTVKRCPQFYRSDEAYKYPGCYNLTKTANSTTEIPDTLLSTFKNEDRIGTPLGLIIPIIIISVLICASLLIYFRHKRNKNKDEIPVKARDEKISPNGMDPEKDIDPYKNESESLQLKETYTEEDDAPERNETEIILTMKTAKE